ncbi:hypothetical protein [Cesiribacter andamanensis]|uniref:hypothetical protein n=1 Tax=Cesiribacter andamanensis TaxID=649507 RepID=UPI0003471A9E|nr:hypothetical protein [Cesiribacter andamanensis]
MSTNPVLYTLVIDRLELTLCPQVEGPGTTQRIFSLPCTGEVYSASPAIALHRISTKVEAYYNYLWLVYYQGEPVAELATSHRLNQGRGEYNKLRFLNPLFYLQPPAYWLQALDAINKALQLQLANIVAVEIAFDANQDFVSLYGERYNHSSLNRHCRTENLEYRPARDYKAKPKDGQQRKPKMPVTSHHGGESFTIGAGNKQINIYDKGAEILKKDKPYIRAFWQASGITSGLMHRVEVKLKGEALEKITPRLRSLTDPSQLLAIFKQEVGLNLTFRELSTREYDRNRNYQYKPAHLIDFSQLPAPALKPVQAIVKPSVPASAKEQRQVKRLIKTLVEAFICFGEEADKEAIERHARRVHFQHLQAVVSGYADAYTPSRMDGSTRARKEEIKSIQDLPPMGWQEFNRSQQECI